MRNIVVVFDQVGDPLRPRLPSNALALYALLETTDPAAQVTLYEPGLSSGLRGRTAEASRATVRDTYRFVAKHWSPGDRIYLFGSGGGAYSARALAQLLDAVGVLEDGPDSLLDYLLATYALPQAHRTAADWRRITAIASALADRDIDDVAAPVTYLGLWDTVALAGLPRPYGHGPDTAPLYNVIAGRHAVAIDAFGAVSLMSPQAAQRVEEVWFRGSHDDVCAGPAGNRSLSDITAEWMLDGALAAGLAVRPGYRQNAPCPTARDALAHTRTAATLRPFGRRTLASTALIHSSVALFAQDNPRYWNRLPDAPAWADPDWPARGEQLAHAADLVA